MENHELFMLISTQLLAQAIALRPPVDDFQELDENWSALDEEGLDSEHLRTVAGYEQLIQMSSDAIAIMAVLQGLPPPLTTGLRGPYNTNVTKCADYFDISLSWPEYMFRHEYRYAKFIDTLFGSQYFVE
jgi:hypothetical protein